MPPVRWSSRHAPPGVFQPLEIISNDSSVTPLLPPHPANPLAPVLDQEYPEESHTPTLLGHGNLSNSMISTAEVSHLGPSPLVNSSAPFQELIHSSTAPLTYPPPSQPHHAHTQLQPPQRERPHANNFHCVLICALKLFVHRHGDGEPLDDDTVSMIMTFLWPHNGEEFNCDGVYGRLVNMRYTRVQHVHEIWHQLEQNALVWQETAQRYYWHWMENMKAVWMQLWSTGHQDYLRAQLGYDPSDAYQEFNFRLFHEWVKQTTPPDNLMLGNHDMNQH